MTSKTHLNFRLGWKGTVEGWNGTIDSMLEGKLTEQEFFSPYTQGFSGIYPGQLCHFVIISRAGEYREKDILPPQCRGTWGDEGIVVGIVVVEGSHRLGSLRDTSNDATSKIGRAELETGLRRLEPSSSFAALTEKVFLSSASSSIPLCAQAVRALVCTLYVAMVSDLSALVSLSSSSRHSPNLALAVTIRLHLVLPRPVLCPPSYLLVGLAADLVLVALPSLLPFSFDEARCSATNFVCVD
ncbi:hypothetical protein BJV77DRAFT_966252 [Russula vinacea]|nr:hypothetical protein BJV77DRAFT_966252 [Russula vinacea]